MKNILQKPELPTGCEATALAIVLNFLGFDADKCEIVDHYMPKTTKLYSMNTHFIGNPYKKRRRHHGGKLLSRKRDYGPDREEHNRRYA